MPASARRTTAWVDTARCAGSGTCVDACPAGAVALVGGRARVDGENCTGCGLCEETCPQAAIQLVVRPERMPVPQGRASDARRRMPLAAEAGAAD